MTNNRPLAMVVDDDPECRALVSTFLSRAGLDVAVAADGESALDMIRAQRPAVVLLDANLPRLDGFAVCTQIKNDPTTASTAVIMLTGFSAADTRDRATHAGADEIVEKPFRAPTLMALVQRILNAQSPV